MVRTILVALALLFNCSAYAEATKPGSYYVTTDRLNVRLKPSSKGKVTNQLDRGQKVEVKEVQPGWARISRYYNGEVEGVRGNVARWVSSSYLSPTKSKPRSVKGASGPLHEALKNSDDYHKHHAAFKSASEKLISQGKCKPKDLEENGGWVRSVNHKPKPVYFTYCGGFHRSNRLYLNISNGTIFR